MRQILLPMFVLAMAAAAPAAAQLSGPPGGDCEDSPDGCGNPGPPPPPSLPGSVGYGGEYKAYIDSNYDSVQGYVVGDQTVRFGGGPLHPIGGDGTVRDGFSASSVTLRGTFPNSADGATVATSTSADVSYASEANAALSYLVELHASNAAAFAALTPLLGTSGAIASISGSYALAATGQAYALAYANTGIYLPLDPSLDRTFGSTCDFSGYYSSTGAGCGAGSYTIDLNFVAGATFTDGDPLSIYGSIYLSADTHAGRTGVAGDAGQSSAFIDPTITLNPLFNSPLYTLNIGNAVVPVPPGAVPEPAAWALLLAGFGVVGGVARRSRLRTVAA
jgi:hypothetical protein